jgi:hypothetical protein
MLSFKIRDPTHALEGATMATPENDTELLEELVQAIRSIAYGSIVLTIHEGRLVEISKTERVRKGTTRPAIER